MSIKPIEHYSITTPATVYDEEALTSLELAARTAAKVNEGVKVINEVEKRVDDAIENIPAVVASDVVKHIQSGDFDKEINDYAGDLEGRLNTILGAFPAGGTSGDAELADIRYDGEQTHPTAGEATRATREYARGTNELIRRAIEAGSINVEYTTTEIQLFDVWSSVNYIDADGHLGKNASDQYYMKRIDARPGNLYYVAGSANYGNAFYVFHDANGEPVSYETSGGGAEIETFKGYVYAPANATSLYVASRGSNTHDITECVITSDHVAASFANVSDAIENLINNGVDNGAFIIREGKPLAGSVNNNKLIARNDEGNPVLTTYSGNIAGYYVSTYEVNAGEMYRVKGYADYENFACAFYDGLYNLTNGEGFSGGEPLYFDRVLIIPAGVGYMSVAGKTGTAVASVTPVENISPNRVGNGGLEWSNIKWTAIGDSITEKNARASKNYLDYIHDETGIVIDNRGVSGTGVLTANMYTKRVDNTFGDVVTIMASFNDVKELFDNDTGIGIHVGDADSEAGDISYCGELMNCIEKIYTFNPKAKIGLIIPPPWNEKPYDATGDVRVEDMIIAVSEVARKYGIPCLDLFYNSGLRPWDVTFRVNYYSKDDGNGVHPDENGHKYFYPLVREFLKKLI